MDYSVLFFLIILTTTQTTSLHHHCNSDAYSSGSGMADLQQLTTLQYCLINNCTIIRNDTGQQLDILYTTQSHLVVIPADGQTSTMLISKNDPEVFCLTTNPTDSTAIAQVVGLIIVAFIASASGYIVVVHMIFKEIRGTFGKLLMFSCISVICNCLTLTAWSITIYNVTVNSALTCYLSYLSFMQFLVVSEAFATSFLAYLAVLMHHSYNSIEMTKQINEGLYKYAVTYTLVLSLLFVFFVVTYDLGTGTYRLTLLPNGHCSYLAQSEYHTIGLFYAYIYVNKIVQLIILATYFVYYFKLDKALKSVRKMANNNTQQNKLFFKIAITMAATLGISQMLLPLAWYFQSRIGIRIVGLLYFIQHCVIMLLYMCTKKMRRLWKKKLCNTETST